MPNFLPVFYQFFIHSYPQSFRWKLWITMFITPNQYVLYEFFGFLRMVHSEIVSQSISAHYTAYPIILGANSSAFVGSGPKIEGEWDYC